MDCGSTRVSMAIAVHRVIPAAIAVRKLEFGI